MSDHIQEQLIAYFNEVAERNVGQTKLEFTRIYNRIYQKYEVMFREISDAAETAEDRGAEINKIAAFIPEYVQGVLLKGASKRKADVLLVDYNMQMVVFVLPMFNQTELEACKEVSNAMVKIWNQTFSVSIGNTEINQIQTGFKQRLCFITTAVCRSMDKPDDCYELTTLRAYRDQYLLQECQEQELVEEYYRIAPDIVKYIDRQPSCDIIYKNILEEYIQPCIQLIETGENEACREHYIKMVRTLQEQYTS